MNTKLCRLRPLRWSDAWFCWRLASDPGVRRVSVDANPPTLRGHLRWMRRHLAKQGDGAAATIILAPDGKRAGVQTLKSYRDSLAVGISFLPQYRGKGYGKYVLSALRAAALLTGRRVYALIKPDNGPSKRAFTKAGFLPVGTTDDGMLLYSTHKVTVGTLARSA